MPVDQSSGALSRESVRVVLRPIGTSLPLASFAFGIGNLLIAAFAAHLIPANEKFTLGLILLAFVAPLELIPCIVAFFARDSAGATATGIFAAGWVIQGLHFMFGDPSAPSVSLGLFLLLLGVCLGILTVVSFSAKPLIGILFTTAVLRSLAAACGQFGVHGAMDSITAVLDALVGIIAFYCALAFLLEDCKGYALPMTFRKNEAKDAMAGSIDDQLKHIVHEAGVRNQM